ncbi:pilus assembly protein PilP [Amphritea sp. HPY]|uniref:pilus assembly protein PilP n=1 Tax=Amphritea sp. HPY TaxID=3421652 RepID=UPI003D7E600B
MMILNSRFRWSVLLALIISSSGCVWIDDAEDLRRFVSQEKQKKSVKVKPLPEFKPYHSFVYEGASLRSPFKPLVALIELVDDDTSQSGTDNGIKPDQQRAKAYLEGFALDNLKMVGTIGVKSGSGLWALIRDGQGEVHRVSVGDFMGLDFGEVVTVKNGRVEIVEIVSNGRGGWMKRPRSVVMDL